MINVPVSGSKTIPLSGAPPPLINILFAGTSFGRGGRGGHLPPAEFEK